MRFQLTDEQRALQDAVRSYLRDRFGPAQVGRCTRTRQRRRPADLWRAMGEQGWLAVLVPEEHDGIGLGLLDAAVLARAFGTGTVPGPWTSTVLLGEALRLAGSPEQQARCCPRSRPVRSRAPSPCSGRAARRPPARPATADADGRLSAGSSWSSTPRWPTGCSSPPRTACTWSTRAARA
jgi:acyl-CoA dehydrogenase